MALIVVCGALVGGGCISQKKIKDLIDKRRAGVRADTIERIKNIMPLITDEHREQCKKLFKSRFSFSGSYRLVSKLHPSLPHSCAAMRNADWFVKPDKIVALVADMQFVRSDGSTEFAKTDSCVLEMVNGKMKIYRGATKARQTDDCHYLWERKPRLDRDMNPSTNKPRARY